MTKLIAFYLPQFHEIPENNEWWGEGFTEWVNTKKARPLFDGHNQPKEPLNDFYYNLLEKETVKWQTELAHKYGVYGFCYYHYWFNGKLLLEKPLENLIKWKDINQKFCISWANEPWARTWDGKNKEVLMPQKYGGKKEWEAHFNYLLKFFIDDRYIKINNKPVLVIYRTESIPQCEAMFDFWNESAKNHGFPGIHIIETLNGFQSTSRCENSDAVVYMEPMVTFRELEKQRTIFKKIFEKVTRNFKKVAFCHEDELIREIIDKRQYCKEVNKKQYLGCFVSWDNTARKGRKGTVLKNTTLENFEKHIANQKMKSQLLDSEFIFINAWNEWAEGTYLEPDKKNEFKYLEIIKKYFKE